MVRSIKVSAHLLPLLALFAFALLIVRLSAWPASPALTAEDADPRGYRGAALLQLSNTPSDTPTDTPVTPSATPSDTATNTPVTPTVTPSDTATSTLSPTPTDTWTPTSTGTITATFTESPAPSATLMPSATRTPHSGSSSGNDDDDDNDSNSGSVGPAVETFLSANLSAVTGGSITVTGGIGNVSLNGETGNVYFHVIALDGQVRTSLAEIGVPSVIERGVIQAVDLFGLLPNGVSVTTFVHPVYVCLRGSGSVIALAAPDRSPIPLTVDPNSAPGYTCVSVSNAGTVVLVQ